MSSSSENKVIESLDFSLYQAKVTEILEGSDLQTITAKSIRKLIQGHFNHDLSLVKKKFDACAIEHFQKYCEFKELAKTFGAGGTSTAASPSVAPKTPVSQKSKAHAEVKVKIESVSPPAVPVKKEKKAAKRVKSSSTVGKDDDSDMNNDDDHDTGLDGEFDYLPHRVTRGGGRASEAASSATSKKRKRNPSSCLVSDKLAAVIGCKEVFKNEITRKVWDYIKANDLQDPSNKQYILCDELLQNLAAEGESISRLYMFHLSRVLTPHITIIKKDTPAKKTKTGGGEASSGSSKFNKLHYLSPALMELAGVEQESRPQVTQKLWAYIKGNNLQGIKVVFPLDIAN
jgi:upstream activation factor subunit UAF30